MSSANSPSARWRFIRDVKRTAERRAAIAALVAEVEASHSVLVLAEDTMAAAHHAAERGLIDPKALIEISGEKRMDDATAPGKTGSPAVEPGTPVGRWSSMRR